MEVNNTFSGASREEAFINSLSGCSAFQPEAVLESRFMLPEKTLPFPSKLLTILVWVMKPSAETWKLEKRNSMRSVSQHYLI